MGSISQAEIKAKEPGKPYITQKNTTGTRRRLTRSVVAARVRLVDAPLDDSGENHTEGGEEESEGARKQREARHYLKGVQERN